MFTPIICSSITAFCEDYDATCFGVSVWGVRFGVWGQTCICEGDQACGAGQDVVEGAGDVDELVGNVTADIEDGDACGRSGRMRRVSRRCCLWVGASLS